MLRALVNLSNLLSSEDGQDIAEYAVMLAVILIIVVATVRLIGSNATTVFSQVASSVGPNGCEPHSACIQEQGPAFCPQV